MKLLSKIALSALLSIGCTCSASIWEHLDVHVMGNQKYLENRLLHNDKRFASFLLALELLQQRHVQTLVETGTARYGTQHFVGDGGSTIIFGNWAHEHNATLYSVDINPQAVAKAKSVVSQYKNNVEIICEDSIEFLTNFDQDIDFLYLDSFDFEIGNPFPSQQHHLYEIEAAYSKLHDHSIVMIDDCDLPHGGKGTLVIEYLLKKGWKVIFKGYQVILTK